MNFLDILFLTLCKAKKALCFRNAHMYPKRITMLSIQFDETISWLNEKSFDSPECYRKRANAKLWMKWKQKFSSNRYFAIIFFSPSALFWRFCWKTLFAILLHWSCCEWRKFNSEFIGKIDLIKALYAFLTMEKYSYRLKDGRCKAIECKYSALFPFIILPGKLFSYHTMTFMALHIFIITIIEWILKRCTNTNMKILSKSNETQTEIKFRNDVSKAKGS